MKIQEQKRNLNIVIENLTLYRIIVVEEFYTFSKNMGEQ